MANGKAITSKCISIQPATTESVSRETEKNAMSAALGWNLQIPKIMKPDPDYPPLCGWDGAIRVVHITEYVKDHGVFERTYIEFDPDLQEQPPVPVG